MLAECSDLSDKLDGLVQLQQDMTSTLDATDARKTKQALRELQLQISSTAEAAKLNITRLQALEVQWKQLQEQLSTTKELMTSLTSTCHQLQQQSLDVTSLEYAREQLHGWQDFAHEKREADTQLEALRLQTAAVEEVAAASCSRDVRQQLSELEEDLLSLNQTIDDEERNLEVSDVTKPASTGFTLNPVFTGFCCRISWLRGKSSPAACLLSTTL